MRFLSVSHSANAFLVMRGPFNPVESFVQTWNGSTGKRRPLDWTVAIRWHAFCSELVRSLSSHPLMPGGPDSRPSYYLTCNGSTGGVPDTDRMFSGRLLTRNAWKLTYTCTRCETVMHRTKLMTHIFWGIIKRGFPDRYKNVLQTLEEHFVSWSNTQFLPSNLAGSHMKYCIKLYILVAEYKIDH